MNHPTHPWKRHLRGILSTILAWIVAMLLYGLVRLYGSHTDGFRGLVKNANWETDVLVLLTTAVLIGLTSGIASIVLDTPSIRRLSFGMTILIKSLTFGVLFLATAFLILFLLDAFVPGASGILQHFGEGTSKEALTAAFAYAMIVNLLVDFFRQLDRKFGPGLLLKFLTGTYHKPKEEERVFMFLDLTSSTAHAERLGHIRYSQLLQDCFLDLTEVVMQFDAEVYQYVGDEVVLTWKVDNNDRTVHCLHTYFAFKQTLERKKALYGSRYGFLPEFKAGAHAGRVTVAEVGEIKREIAFHGDVLNTAARIRSKCNEFGVPLLVSETLRASVGDKNRYVFNKIGNVDLRGKQNAVSLHSVEYSLPKTSHEQFQRLE